MNKITLVNRWSFCPSIAAGEGGQVNKTLGIFFLGILLAVLGCAGEKHYKWPKFSGTLELTEHSLGPVAAGKLADVWVKEGDRVTKGQLLAALERYPQAQRDYERTTKMFASGGATRQEVEWAQLAAADQCVRSSVDGVVLLRVHEAGEVVAAGAPVVVVGDRSELWVKIFVPEGIINRLQMKQKAIIRVDGLKESFSGRVSFIASRAEFTPRNVQTEEERITQAFSVKITFDQPPDFLRPGVAADVFLKNGI